MKHMKLRKIEICIILAAVLVALLAAGYFWGRAAVGGDVVIETENTAPPESAEAADSTKTVDSTASAASEEPSSTAAAAKININTATAAELEALPHIGEAIAQRIVEYREADGPFAYIEEIMYVKGVGEVTFADIEELITVGE